MIRDFFGFFVSTLSPFLCGPWAVDRAVGLGGCTFFSLLNSRLEPFEEKGSLASRDLTRKVTTFFKNNNIVTLLYVIHRQELRNGKEQ